MTDSFAGPDTHRLTLSPTSLEMVSVHTIAPTLRYLECAVTVFLVLFFFFHVVATQQFLCDLLNNASVVSLIFVLTLN